MAIAPELHAAYRDAARSRGNADPSIAWFQPERMAALERFIEHGFPTAREEEWKYTDLADLDRRAAQLLTAPAAGAAALPETMALLDGGEITLTLVNGTYIPGLSAGALPAGVRLRRLRDLAADTPLAAGAARPGTPLHQLNTGLLSDTVVLEIAPHVRLEQPIRIVLTTSQPGAFANRVLVSLGRDSSATLIEHHCAGAGALANSVTRVDCGPGAGLDYVRLQEDHDGSIHLSSQEMTLEAGARVSIASLDLGGALARVDLAVSLAGEQSRSDAFGLILADGSRHVDNHTRFDHRSPNAVSRTTFRAIATGKSRAVFNGKIVVNPGAGGTDAELRNANLLLSTEAEIDTKPELEIYADEVKCSHGATTGQLDEQAIFYLRSRGITLSEARRMLIEAFAQDICRGIRHEDLRAVISGRLARRLAALGLAGATP